MNDSPQTVDQALARAESALVNGRLADAAATLEKGLAGEWNLPAMVRAGVELPPTQTAPNII